MGTAVVLCLWGLQGCSVVRHCQDVLHWTLHGYSAIRHCTEGRENIDSLKSNNSRVRMRNKEQIKTLFKICSSALAPF